MSSTSPYTPSSAIDFIEHFEGSGLNFSSPFYYEIGTDTINFGYGINLTSAEDQALKGNATYKNDLITWFKQNGIQADNTTIAGIPWTSLSTPSLSSSSLADFYIAIEMNANIPSADYSNAANSILTSYVNTFVVPELTKNIPNFSSLPATTQWALEAMYYNGPLTLGPITYTAANNYIPGNGSLAVIAEQLAFAANSKTNSNESGLEERYLGSALLAMGVIPTYDAQNVITSVDASGANTQDVINFLEAAVANPIIGSGGISAVDYVSKWGLDPLESYNNMVAGLSQYLTTQNYFVPTATDYNPTGNTTLTGNANPDTYVFTPGDGSDQITSFSTSKGDVLRFDGGVTLTGLSGSENGSALTISYGSGDSVTLDGFFLRETPVVTTTENGSPLSIYNINVEQGNQSPQAETVIQSGSTIIMTTGVTYGTDFVVPDNDVATLIGTGSSNTIDLSTATGNIDVNTFTGTITGGDPINDQVYNIQNVIGDAGNDTITSDNINFTAQSDTTSVVNGTGNTVTLGSNDLLTVAAGPNETSFQDTVNAGSSAVTDTINFEGQSIAGSLTSGSTDSDGRRYDLNGTTLTIDKGADSLTINNFQNGDYGINLGYNFSEISVPGEQATFVTGISDSGTIVGFSGSAPFLGEQYGYTGTNAFVDNAGTITSIGTFGTMNFIDGLNGYPHISSGGEIVDGTTVYGDPTISAYFAQTGFSPIAGNTGGVFVGQLGYDDYDIYTRASGYNFIGNSYDNFASGASLTNAITDINDSGTIVGYKISNGYTIDSMGSYGIFGYALSNGVTTLISDPNATYGNAADTTLGTYVTSINDKGVIAGFYTDSFGAYHGFIDKAGVFTTVDVPGPSTPYGNSGNGTIITGINDSGDIVGYTVFGNSEKSFLGTVQNSTQSIITQSNSTINVANNADATVASSATGNTINLGSSASVTVLANNTTVNGIVGDYITVKSNNNNLLVAPSDPVSIIGGSDNVTDITGSAVIAHDDTASSSNTFIIESTSRGDTITLGGTGDTVNDSGSGNTIIIADNAGGNDTITGGTSADTFVIGANAGSNTISNFNQTDTLSFSDLATTANNVTTSRVGNDLVFSTGVTLAGFFNNFTGSSTSLNVTFAQSGATTLNISSTGQIIPSGSSYLPPVAETDNINANNQASVTGNVLVNNGNGPDTDPNGLALSVQAETLTTATGGTFILNTDGSFTYTAAAFYRGSDSVTYTLEDTAGLSTTGTVNISNIYTYRPPVAQTGYFSGSENTALTGNVITNNGNPDTDQNGMALSVQPETVTTAKGDTLVLNADGNFTLTPAAGFYGMDSFSYTLQDASGLTAIGNVNVYIAPTPPVAEPGNFSVNENSVLSGNVITNNGNPDTDPNGLALSVKPETITTTNGGTLILNVDGSFTYTPISKFFGTDSFSYTLQDTAGATSTGNVTINVAQLPPVAGLDTVDAQHTGAASGNVLVNDSDPSGLALSTAPGTITTADGGIVTLDAAGNFTYQAKLGFRGNDSFTYTLEDTTGLTTIGTVDLNNVFTDRPPVAVDESFTAAYGQTITANVLAKDYDPDGDPMHVVQSTVTTADGFIINLNPNGTFAYTPEAGFLGTDSFTYTVADPYGKTDSATVTLDVTAPPDSIVGTAGNDTLIGTAQDNILFGLGGNDTLIGGPTADTMYGGKGNDTYIVNNVNDVIVENPGEGTDSVFSSVSYTLPANVENITLTGHRNINATGNAESNIITGNSGDNILNDGGAGGADTLIGGKGNDTYIVNNIADKIVESAHGGFDKVLSSVSYTLSANVEELKLTGTANINATGNGQGSILIGNSGNNILNDGGPLPTSHGHDDCRDEERGRNIMIGGAGNDTYIVNNKNDVIIEKKNGGTDTVISSVSWRLGQNLENLTLTGMANLNATGNCENNIIIGNSGNNIIDGEGGNNTLTGGGGADTFVMQASEAYHGIDTITDFSVQQGDKLKILGIRDFHSFEEGDHNGHHNDCYHGHHATLADYVRITTSGNNSIVSVDANGRGNDFTQIAVLQNVTGLSASALVNSGNMLLQ